jgi:hypothetical protein
MIAIRWRSTGGGLSQSSASSMNGACDATGVNRYNGDRADERPASDTWRSSAAAPEGGLPTCPVGTTGKLPLWLWGGSARFSGVAPT